MAGGWQAKPPTCVLSEGGGSGGRESPPSLESQVGGSWLVACLVFRVREGLWWAGKPPTCFLSKGGVMVGGKSLHWCFKRRRGLWRVVDGRQSLPLAFRAREEVMVGANPLCHLNCEWEGGRWYPLLHQNAATSVVSK